MTFADTRNRNLGHMYVQSEGGVEECRLKWPPFHTYVSIHVNTSHFGIIPPFWLKHCVKDLPRVHVNWDRGRLSVISLTFLGPLLWAQPGTILSPSLSEAKEGTPQSRPEEGGPGVVFDRFFIRGRKTVGIFQR